MGTSQAELVGIQPKRSERCGKVENRFVGVFSSWFVRCIGPWPGKFTNTFLEAIR